jgi:hypothetical protein
MGIGEAVVSGAIFLQSHGISDSFLILSLSVGPSKPLELQPRFIPRVKKGKVDLAGQWYCGEGNVGWSAPKPFRGS